ncbi:PIN-like domain-containing protein [Thalassolituus sp. C2-1]|uniref:PIN-like domain-containing protein n=1 Tax=Venatorbacter sp. C2-1 TaxID=2597518 RepID=UPI0011916B73|nr:PIN-like domain-containing protein [Thalassolituus sp. C2-1]TVV43300.1 hypothetical protein FOT50_12760 [Thalassolituus sp. C2-1]
MKTIFNGYYKLTTDEFSTLWKNAIFVFDTNVLLNLYRYQTSTRDSLFSVVERLADRVWIPYHVGLEFQRNRLQVIADQHKRYSEVRNIVTKSISGMQSELEGLQLKKRHSHIDPDKLIIGINSIKDGFLSELDSLEEKSISVNSTDTIRDRIDKLFEGKVGDSPDDQKEIDDLFKEAEERYKCSIPPGFKDSNKDDKNPDEFTYGGITYKRKYGDILVWKQIIKEAKNRTIKDIIFITDDNKSDWWWQIDSNGKKNIGVRPELTDELKRETGVERFYVYNTEGFLSYANEQLDAQVTEEAIEEVREVSVARRSRAMEMKSIQRLAMSAEKAVFEWLSSSFSNLEENRRGFPDFVGYQDNLKFGFEVKVIREPRMLMHRIRDMIHQAYFMLNENGFYEVALIFVVLNEDDLDEVLRFAKLRMPEMGCNLRVIVGKAEFDEEANIAYGFIPYDEIRSSHSM